MSTRRKVAIGLGLLGAAGLATWAFWPKTAAAATRNPQLPATATPAPPLYIPPTPPADVLAGSTQYTVEDGDSFSGIAEDLWDDLVSYPGYELWLLLWSANKAAFPDPNVIHPGDVITVPPLTAFSDADIAKARANYLNWRAYSQAA